MRLRKNKSKHPSHAAHAASNPAQKKATLLEELGRSPDEHPTFSLPSPLLPWGGVIAAILFTLITPSLIKDGPVGVLLAAALILATFVVMLVPRKLLVGHDGLLLVWMLGSRFIRYRELDYVDTVDGIFFRHPGINLALKNGHTLDFSTSLFKERWAERDALIRLIRLCSETAKGKKTPPVQQSLLRAGKPHGVWARMLLSMSNGAHVDPRTPAVLQDDLLRIAESPDISAIDRTAAIVALGANRDATLEKRLRVSIEHTVAPEVRSALREALDAGEDEERITQLLQRTEKMTSRD
jgi:hypothetical protein